MATIFTDSLTALADAQATIREIEAVLCIWSKRQPLVVSPDAQREIDGMFESAHRQLAKAQHGLNSRLQGEVSRSPKPVQGSRYRAKQTQPRVGVR